MARIDPRWVPRKYALARWAVRHGVPVPTGKGPKFFHWTPWYDRPTGLLIAAITLKAWGAGRAVSVWTPAVQTLVMPDPVGVKALRVAQTQVGVHESPAGSNDGPQVHVYQSITGAYRAPWCASFVSWCFYEVGHRLSGFNTAYCPSFVDSARAGRNGLSLVSRSSVRAGDLALFDWNADGVADHIGIVSSTVSAAGSFTTVEGNTSGPGGDQSNGGEVWRQTRYTGQVLAFVRVAG